MSSDTTHAAVSGLRTVMVEGTALAYREQGEGAPVVLVHGSASDLRSWDQQLPAIGASYRTIAYSRRYARPNRDIEPGADDPMLPHVDDLAALLQALGAAPAHLVGHSWGAFICLLAAIRHPELVRSLVLAEPPVLSLFISTPPRAAELLPLLVRRPADRADHPRLRRADASRRPSGPSGVATTSGRWTSSPRACSARRSTRGSPRRASARRART